MTRVMSRWGDTADLLAHLESRWSLFFRHYVVGEFVGIIGCHRKMA